MSPSHHWLASWSRVSSVGVKSVSQVHTAYVSISSFQKSSRGTCVYVRSAVIQVTKFPLVSFQVSILWTRLMRNKPLKADSADSHFQKQTQIFDNREKTICLWTIYRVWLQKKHERYNSGFETNLLNCKTWECGSFWEEALRQSYDLWLQWREREKERERKREGGQIQLTALVNMWGGVAGWEWWKWITTLWKIRFLPIISECNYKRRTENPFPQQAPSL